MPVDETATAVTTSPGVELDEVDTGHRIEAARRQRRELREAIGEMEKALAAAMPGRVDAWWHRYSAALGRLASAYREHVRQTEGPGGVTELVLVQAPRLALQVDKLVEEHREIQAGLDDLLACCQGPAEAESLARARDLSTSLLGRLVRHRQFGADLIYEAVHVDLGGET